MSEADIRAQLTRLGRDLEALRPLHRSSPEVQERIHRTVSVIHDLDIPQIAASAVAVATLLQSVEKVRASTRSFQYERPDRALPHLLPYLGEVQVWLMSLPGDPTTPPPIFRETADVE